MRIVEREGTGMRSRVKPTSLIGVLGLLLTGFNSAVQASEPALAVEQCAHVSVAVAVEGQLFAGVAPLDSGYALVDLVAINPVPDTNAAGEGTGINSAGEGTGAPGSGAQTNAAGEGTGLEEVVDPGTNAAGEGTGSPQGLSIYAEVLLNDEAGADLVIYQQGNAGTSEMKVFSNVAVSGLASGNGCDRE